VVFLGNIILETQNLILLGASFIMVLLRGFQQQNVIHSYYYWAVLTTWGLSVAEVAMLLYVVKIGWEAVPYIGLGGSFGVVSAMYIHKRFIRK
jgi:hypothetical protein